MFESISIGTEQESCTRMESCDTQKQKAQSNLRGCLETTGAEASSERNEVNSIVSQQNSREEGNSS